MVDGEVGLTHEHVLGIERSEYDTPRVSPYRLAAHLSMAFATWGAHVDGF